MSSKAAEEERGGLWHTHTHTLIRVVRLRDRFSNCEIDFVLLRMHVSEVVVLKTPYAFMPMMELII